MLKRRESAMRAILLLLLTSAATVAAAPGGKPVRIPAPAAALEPANKCIDLEVHWTKRNSRPGAGKLGDQPPGSLYSTVLREMDGCKEAVLLRQGMRETRTVPPGRSPRR
jgi:hypothetical protein